MRYLSPSILSADFTCLGKDLQEALDGGADFVHIDVMDGVFVPQISFGHPVIKGLRPMTKAVFDVHLMITDPMRYIREFADAGADIICVHAEACTHLDRVINEIIGCGKKAAVALNPATPLEVLDYVLPDLYMVLIMSVNPGYGGQKYIPYTDEKLRRMKAMIRERGLDTLVEVDGGVTQENAQRILSCGADVLVAGSAVFNGDIRKNAEEFKKIMNER